MSTNNTERAMMTQSLHLNNNNFRNDIITPTIYADQNFHILLHNQPKRKTLSKVSEVKKNRVQAVVQRIVSKKTMEISKKQPYYEHKLTGNYKKNQKTYSKTKASDYKLENMVMDLDQGINEKAQLADEYICNQRETLNGILAKIKKNGPKTNATNSAIEFYITSISPRKILPSQKIYVRPQTTKQIKGWVEEEQEKHRKWLKKQGGPKQKRKTESTRPKTANTLYKTQKSNSKAMMSSDLMARPNSLTNMKLSRYGFGQDFQFNINAIQKNKQEKNKLENILNKIQDSTFENSIMKQSLISKLERMKVLWKSQDQFLNATDSVTLTTKPETLKLLQSRRIKEAAIMKIDEDYMNNN